MKLLIVTNLFPNAMEPSRATYNFQQFSSLTKFCELKVVAPLPFPQYSAAQVPPVEQVGGIEVFHPRYLVIPGILRFTYGLAFFAGIWRTLKAINRSFGYDVVLAAWAYPDAVGTALAARLLGKPFYVITLGSDINLAGRYWGRTAMIRWAISRAEKVIAVSRPLKHAMTLMGIAAEKIVVIPNGVDATTFYPKSQDACRDTLGLDRSARYVVSVGNLARVKGSSYLIKAFSQLAASASDLNLVLVGDGEDRARLTELARGLGVSDRVRFIGRTRHQDIPDWMNAADVLCLPSLNEGCPNVLLEALACGAKVVASNVGGVPDILEAAGTGWLATPGDPDDLARSLAAALDAPRQTTGKGTISWDDNAKALFEVIRRRG